MIKNEKKVVERKKNKSTKTAIVLFGGVLITTSLLGGTLAKYVSDVGQASDSARVAKWGVEADFKDFNLFDKQYLGEGDESSKNTIDAPVNVFGPGSGNGVAATNKSAILEIDTTVVAKLEAPEVAYTIQYNVATEDFTGIDGKSYKKSGYTGKWQVAAVGDNPGDKNYTPAANDPYWYPIQFKVTLVDADGNAVTGANAKSYDGFSSTDNGAIQLKNVIDLINSAKSETIYPGTTGAAATDAKAALDKFRFKIEWKWPFDYNEKAAVAAVGIWNPTTAPGNYTGTVNEAIQNGWDTQLGNRAVSVTGDDELRLTFTVKAKAVQVD